MQSKKEHLMFTEQDMKELRSRRTRDKHFVESNKDFVCNNIDLCARILERLEKAALWNSYEKIDAWLLKERGETVRTKNAEERMKPTPKKRLHHVMIDKAVELCGIKETGDNRVPYVGVLPTGQHGLCDYNTGFLWVSIFLARRYNKGQEPDYEAKFCISSIDDGSWEATGPRETEEQARDRARKAYEKTKDLVALPSAETLNEMFVPLGMYGVYE